MIIRLEVEMANENKDVKENESENVKPTGGAGKLVTILVLLNTVLILVGGGYFLFFKKAPKPQVVNMNADNKKAEKKQKDNNDEENDSKEFGDSEEYKGIVVNLNEPGGNRMLKVSLTFEFKAKNKKLSEELKKRESQIRSVIIMYMSGLSYVQTTGSANKELILKTIKKKVNDVITEGKVRGVFFKEFVVQ
jgi:flagellar FliL protein